MDRHLFGGILWTAGAKWSSQVFSWASLILVARFVSPKDFGLVGMAGVYLDIARVVSQFGIGAATITLRNLTGSEIKQINSVAVLLAILMFALSCAAAGPLGLFFHSPRLPMVVVVMSVTMLAAGIQTIPYSLLQREFRFKLLSVTQTVATLVQGACTLILAFLGYGYWALVAGLVVGAVIPAAAAVMWEPRGFDWPRLKAIHHALRFSWHVLVAHLAWTFYTGSDFLIAGRMLGASALGEYGLAYNLATMPVEKVTSLVGQVTPAVFSARQADHGELRRYLLLLIEGVAIITFPMGIGLALTARDVIPLIFGHAWLGAVVPLQILAFLGCARSVGALTSPVLTALHDTRYVMRNNLVSALVMPAAFYVGSRWGAGGIATVWIIGYPVILWSLSGRAFRMIGLHWRACIKALSPATSAVAVMAILVELLRLTILRSGSPWTRVVVEVGGGALAYLGALLLLHADRVRAMMNWYARLRAGGAPSARAME